MLPTAPDRAGRVGRILRVTAGVALLGGLAGAAMGMAVASIFMLGGGSLRGILGLLGIGGAIGAGCGLILGPLVAWTMLREVPLGRAAVETSIAAAVGGVLGLGLPNGHPIGFVPGILLGLLPAVLHLKWRFRGRK